METWLITRLLDGIELIVVFREYCGRDTVKAFGSALKSLRCNPLRVKRLFLPVYMQLAVFLFIIACWCHKLLQQESHLSLHSLFVLVFHRYLDFEILCMEFDFIDYGTGTSVFHLGRGKYLFHGCLYPFPEGSRPIRGRPLLACGAGFIDLWSFQIALCFILNVDVLDKGRNIWKLLLTTLAKKFIRVLCQDEHLSGQLSLFTILFGRQVDLNIWRFRSEGLLPFRHNLFTHLWAVQFIV